MSKDSQKEINILDVFITLARHKLFIFKIVFSITLLALIISLLWPHTYKSSATFVPVTPPRALAGGLSGLLGGAMQLPMDAPRVNPEVISHLLHSRELREQVIHHFNFQEIYRTDLMELLLLKIDENIEITENREGGFGFNPIYSMNLAFYSREPGLSYEVVSYMLGLLNDKVQSINMENAVEQLEILQDRFHRNEQELTAAEEALQTFQERYGILEVEEQAKQIVEKLGRLKASSIETEMKISVLSQTVSDDHAELRNLRRIKSEYDRQFDQLLRQSDQEASLATGFYPLLDLPGLGIRYFRLFRDLEIQAMILETLYPQLETQKMIVEANRRGIQIIDPPRIPTYKDGPKRAFIVLGGLFFSLFLALTIVFFREMMEKGRERDSENYRKMQELLQHLTFRKTGKPAP